MSKECLFCQIARHELPTTAVFENERIIAFRDIHPDAPTHIQLIPKEHITSLAETTAKDQDLLGELLVTAASIAREQGIAESGYRCVINTKEHGGQLVPHLHIHIMGGRQMGSSHG